MFTRPSGVMFHYIKSDGLEIDPSAASSDDLQKVIDYVARDFNLLSAEDFTERVITNRLMPHDVCLTMDDGLASQYHLAAPVLKKNDIRAFYFINTGPLFGDSFAVEMELDRYLINSVYPSVENFYTEFFHQVRKRDESLYQASVCTYEASGYLSGFSFYSEVDRLFRWFRDKGDRNHFRGVMDDLKSMHAVNENEARSKIWMTESNISDLAADGHIIGLHSYSHPPNIGELTRESQMLEFLRNRDHLTAICGNSITAMSYPFGRYNSITLNVLRELGIIIGFRSNDEAVDNRTYLELPRIDVKDFLKHISVHTAEKSIT